MGILQIKRRLLELHPMKSHLNKGSLYGNPLDPKQVAFFEELLMSRLVWQEVPMRLIVKNGVFLARRTLCRDSMAPSISSAFFILRRGGKKEWQMVGKS